MEMNKKKEEIREGIKDLIVDYVCPLNHNPTTAFERGLARQLEGFSELILNYLHSQGVVIKAESIFKGNNVVVAITEPLIEVKQ